VRRPDPARACDWIFDVSLPAPPRVQQLRDAHSLGNLSRRLEEGVKRAQELARFAPAGPARPEELEEMEESERERLEAMLEAGDACRKC